MKFVYALYMAESEAKDETDITLDNLFGKKYLQIYDMIIR